MGISISSHLTNTRKIVILVSLVVVVIFFLNFPTNSRTMLAYGNVSVYVDSHIQPIAISVISPKNITYYTNTIVFIANSNTEIDTWILNYNGTNMTLSPSPENENVTSMFINLTLYVPDGQYHLLVYANDSYGYWGVNDSIYFAVDTVPKPRPSPGTGVSPPMDYVLTIEEPEPREPDEEYYVPPVPEEPPVEEKPRVLLPEEKPLYFISLVALSTIGILLFSYYYKVIFRFKKEQ